MSAPFDPLAPGDFLQPYAEEWNAMLAAGKAHQRRETLPGLTHALPSYPLLVAKIKNMSGATVNRFGVLGLSTPLFLPADNLPEFKRQPAFTGLMPATGTHEAKFAIALEPIASGKIGDCALLGVVPCKIAFAGSPSNRAEVTNGSTATLTSNTAGSAQILWIEASGSSPRWALIRLPAGGASSASCDIPGAAVKTQQIVESVSGSFNPATCVLTLNVTTRTIKFCGTVTG